MGRISGSELDTITTLFQNLSLDAWFGLIGVVIVGIGIVNIIRATILSWWGFAIPRGSWYVVTCIVLLVGVSRVQENMLLGEAVLYFNIFLGILGVITIISWLVRRIYHQDHHH